MKNKILIFGIKEIILISILPRDSPKPSCQHYHLLSPIQIFPCSKKLYKVNLSNFNKLTKLT